MDLLNSSYISSLSKQVALTAILLLMVFIVSRGNPSVPVIVFSASLSIVLIAYSFVTGVNKKSSTELASEESQTQGNLAGDDRISQKTPALLAKMLALVSIVDFIGRKLMGDLWKTFYESVQDAIVLGLLLQIPNLIGNWIIGENFSSLNHCLSTEIWSVNRYACFVIVLSDFLLWILLAGRILGRFLADLINLIKAKG